MNRKNWNAPIENRADPKVLLFSIPEATECLLTRFLEYLQIKFHKTIALSQASQVHQTFGLKVPFYFMTIMVKLTMEGTPAAPLLCRVNSNVSPLSPQGLGKNFAITAPGPLHWLASQCHHHSLRRKKALPCLVPSYHRPWDHLHEIWRPKRNGSFHTQKGSLESMSGCSLPMLLPPCWCFL